MLVCHCKVVTDHDIRAAIEAGARDEFDIATACGAGAECGGCIGTVQALLGECVGCPLAATSPPADALSHTEPSRNSLARLD